MTSEFRLSIIASLMADDDGRIHGYSDAIPKGWYNAVFCDHYDQGWRDTQFGPKRFWHFRWQLDHRSEHGRRYTVGADFSATLAPRSKLRRLLEIWRLVPFTEHELKFGFDPEVLIGKPAMVYLDHVPIKDGGGNVYVKVLEVVPIPGGVQPLTIEGTYVRVRDRFHRESQESDACPPSSPSASEPSSEDSSSPSESPSGLAVRVVETPPSGTGTPALIGMDRGKKRGSK